MQPNFKPAPGTGRIERYQRRILRRALKMRSQKAEDRAEQARQKLIRLSVYTRDHGRCRAFGVPLKFESDNLLKRSECHHIVYRSAGGTWDTFNLCTLSPKAHRMEHEGLLEVSGNADHTLTFTEFEYRSGTRTFVRTWESAI